VILIKKEYNNFAWNVIGLREKRWNPGRVVRCELERWTGYELWAGTWWRIRHCPGWRTIWRNNLLNFSQISNFISIWSTLLVSPNSFYTQPHCTGQRLHFLIPFLLPLSLSVVSFISISFSLVVLVLWTKDGDSPLIPLPRNLSHYYLPNSLPLL